MIYSKYNIFFFIHLYKTGGTSVTESLIPHCFHPVRVLLNCALHKPKYDRKLVQPCVKHATAVEIRTQLGADVYDKAFSFAFVRNPWDLEVSLYKYLCRWERGPNWSIITEMDGFDDFVHWRHQKRITTQFESLHDENDRSIVDFIGRFENLESDFLKASQMAGVTATLGRLNVSKRREYQRYYSKESISIVEKTYAEEIDLFSYTF